MKVSNCCGARPQETEAGPDTMELGICSACHNHCEYVEYIDEDTECLFDEETGFEQSEHEREENGL